ncbi:MAG TPA: L,D-transpeptidase [Xanthobacteraceae bacterium]|nr:L,D-transpeptidase [Xanthobacteraceae bacterium]
MSRLCNFAAALVGAWFCLNPLSAQAGILITIDKAQQQMTVDIDGQTRWIWPVSTGRRGYDTPAGSFRPFRLEEDHYSKEWDEAPMPHSIFFTGEGHAIHGSYETRRLGRPASHGCVRLAPRNAEKLFTLVKREGLGNTRVVVLQDRDAPVVAKKRTPAPAAQKVQQARKTVPAPAAPLALPATAESPAYPLAPAQTSGYAPAQPAAAPPLMEQSVTGLPASAAVGSAPPAAPGWN